MKTFHIVSRVAASGGNPEEIEFEALCRMHDLTYAFSDDYAVQKRGRDQHAAIVIAAKALNPGRAKLIWDAVVDEKIEPDFRAGFYWRLP